ncbi:hypothetical protein EVAR_41172_1 [Eumeta japonica]|uniref:Uncharacterized protein n=1 Tax=Eumeta variegata TaxID=151549 RepID=A0A4C1YDA0_EUMVA|nr:hypothetical protein EVAR_41172_1 [Eumeta japonica]
MEVGIKAISPPPRKQALPLYRLARRYDRRADLVGHSVVFYKDDVEEVARMIRPKLVMDSDGYSLYQRDALMRPLYIYKIVGSSRSRVESIVSAHKWPSQRGRIFGRQFERKKNAVSSANNASWTPHDGRGISFMYAEYSNGKSVES